MPSLDFYAHATDHAAVLGAVFDSGHFTVFEAYSEPDAELRAFTGVEALPESALGLHLMLYADGSGPAPSIERVGVPPSASGGGTHRFRCQGWGLIQLHLGAFFHDDELRRSHTAHNTEKRAHRWSATSPGLGDPTAWDWAVVTQASSRLNRRIRSLAVDRIGPRPVLPRAADLIERHALRHEYGTGLHAHLLEDGRAQDRRK